jgi:hypothetical protein
VYHTSAFTSLFVLSLGFFSALFSETTFDSAYGLPQLSETDQTTHREQHLKLQSVLHQQNFTLFITGDISSVVQTWTDW